MNFARPPLIIGGTKRPPRCPGGNSAGGEIAAARLPEQYDWYFDRQRRIGGRLAILAVAAKLLHQWGAKEILITHNTEVLVFDGEKIRTCPIKARPLPGEPGERGEVSRGVLSIKAVRA